MVSLCVVFALGFVACGSDKTTTASPDADRATAKKLVLTTTDFPSGWTGKPDDQTRSEEAKAASKELSDCVGTSGAEAETARWKGDEFTKDQYQVSSNANLVADKAAFKKDVAAINSPKLQTCVKDIFGKLLTQSLGAPPTSLDVTPFEVKKYGAVTVGLRLRVGTGTSTGTTETVYVDLVLMGKNRAENTTTIFSIGQPMDPALENSLLAKVGSHVNAA